MGKLAILLFAALTAASVVLTCGVSEGLLYANESKGQGGDSSQTPIFGTVFETMNGGGYTYLHIETSGQKKWVAVRQMEAFIGQKVVLKPGFEMTNFTSKALNRTFSSIIFSEGQLRTKGAGGQGQAGGSPFQAGAGGSAYSAGGHGGGASGHEGHDHGSEGGGHGGADSMGSSHGKIAVEAEVGDVKVEKATGPNAVTIVELYDNRSTLNKKDVELRAKVVKVMTGILGKNWLHVQDGSGSSQNGTHDIVVTTMELPNVGDVVLINGVLFKDKDFGSGYKYDAIVEEARLTK